MGSTHARLLPYSSSRPSLGQTRLGRPNTSSLACLILLRPTPAGLRIISSPISTLLYAPLWNMRPVPTTGPPSFTSCLSPPTQHTFPGARGTHSLCFSRHRQMCLATPHRFQGQCAGCLGEESQVICEHTEGPPQAARTCGQHKARAWALGEAGHTGPGRQVGGTGMWDGGTGVTCAGPTVSHVSLGRCR